METEDVHLNFTDDAIESIATISADVNAAIENIGARRLHTVLERVLEEISFQASDKGGTGVNIDKEYVEEHLGELATNMDLSKFIL